MLLLLSLLLLPLRKKSIHLAGAFAPRAGT
jgi:hypothetical protein